MVIAWKRVAEFSPPEVASTGIDMSSICYQDNSDTRPSTLKLRALPSLAHLLLASASLCSFLPPLHGWKCSFPTQRRKNTERQKKIMETGVCASQVGLHLGSVQDRWGGMEGNLFWVLEAAFTGREELWSECSVWSCSKSDPGHSHLVS